MEATTCPASLPAVTRLAVYRRPHIEFLSNQSASKVCIWLNWAEKHGEKNGQKNYFLVAKKWCNTWSEPIEKWWKTEKMRKIEVFWKFFHLFGIKSAIFSKNYVRKSIESHLPCESPGGDQVGGLPPAPHTDAAGVFSSRRFGPIRCKLVLKIA